MASQLGPGVRACEFFQRAFSDLCSPVGLETGTLLVFKVRFFRDSCLKHMGCPMWVLNPQLLRKKLQVLSSFCIVGCCSNGGVYGGVASQPLLLSLMCFSSCLPNVQSSSTQTLGFLKGNSSIYSCRLSMAVGGGEFGIFLCHHLEPGLLHNILKDNFLQ